MRNHMFFVIISIGDYMRKVFLYLYPIYDYYKIYLYDNDKTYEYFNRERPFPVMNKAIDLRYRQNGYDIYYLLYSDSDMYGLEQIPGDRIIRSNICFEDSTPYNADGTCKDDFVYKYTDPNYVFDLIGDFDELVVGGNHAMDCVKRMAEAALSRGISSLVDLDLTDFFFMLYWKRDYFDIAEYSPSRYKEFALLKRGEKNYELTKRIFERSFASLVYGFEEEKRIVK